MRARVAASFFVGASCLWAQSYTISTFAGAPLPPLPAPALSVSAGYTTGVASDTVGNVYLAGWQLNAVFRASQNGIMTLAAGTGRAGNSGDNGPASNAQMYEPFGVAVDGNGNLYIADPFYNCIREVSAAGIITTIAGTGTQGYSGDGGPAVDAQLYGPSGVAVDGSGNVYIADTYNYRIREIATTGIITTIAGTGEGGDYGYNGPALEAPLDLPEYIAADASGNVYVGDFSNCRIRKISTNGTISTVAGNGICGYSGDGGGAASSAEVRDPEGVAVDTQGNIYIADAGNNVIREVYAAGTIATIAGNGTSGYSGDGGRATSAQLDFPLSVTLDGNGNLYIWDYSYHVREVSTAGTITTFAGNGDTETYSGDGGPAVIAQLSYPGAAAVDSAGNVYISDAGNNRIRMVSVTGAISTVVGNGTSGYTGDNGPAVHAELCDPGDITFDADGNLYIADSCNWVVRKVTPGGTISTVAGNGKPGFSGNGGPATGNALFIEVGGVAVDANGNLYVSDPVAEAIRIISTDGIVSTAPGLVGANGSFYEPKGLAFDSSGNLYITDLYSGTNGQLLKLTPTGTISTVLTGLSGAAGVAVDGIGNIYIARSSANEIVKLSAGGSLSTIAGTSGFGYSGDGGPAISAQLSGPGGVAVGLNGTLYIADTENLVVRELSPCVQSLASAVSADATAQTVNVPITAVPTCQWSATSLPTWITGVSSGTGTGTVAITLQANTTGANRNATITVNGLALSITQDFTAQVFVDVSPTANYFNAVDLLSQQGITNGCSATPLDFCPNDDLIRADAAIFIVRAIYGGTDNFPYSTTPYFNDVSPTDFGFPWIQHLYELGITTGCGPQLFCPNDPATRAEMAIFTIRMRYGSMAAFDYPPTPYFSDVTTSTFGWAWIQRMGEDNISSGCAPLLYCPGDAITRGDAAIFIMRGGFNDLLPSSEAVLWSISPATIAPGASGTFTVTGVNTAFVQGTTSVAPIPGVTVGTVTVMSPTMLTVELTAAADVVQQPVSILAITGFPPGNEEAVLPNGLVIQ